MCSESPQNNAMIHAASLRIRSRLSTAFELSGGRARLEHLSEPFVGLRLLQKPFGDVVKEKGTFLRPRA
ncbi:hypothetical protein E2C01_064713 [Portunus trituberculatus]|uniref:Uncharacterized protein n=1 Tax=Portunus trituberculatus TaxID=210409 RepID=A0A5B7HPJ0_PORTR|nr:hypothetical protein [Portunus trituberculatus]